MSIHLLESLKRCELDRLSDKQVQILEAAIGLFAEKGYAATSTSEIAKRAEVAEGTIFRYYKTKKDLLMSISTISFFKIFTPAMIKQMKEDVLNKDLQHFDDFIREITYNRYQVAKNNLPLLKIFIQELNLHHEIKELFFLFFKEEMAHQFNDLIRYFQSSNEIVDATPQSILRFIASAVFGLIINNLVLNVMDEDKEKEEIEMTIKFIINGLKSKSNP